MTDWKFDAFISYRRSDGAAAANWLRREIQSFRAPKRLRDKAGDRLRVYLDTAYERGTIDFYEKEIRPALLASHYLIVLATPEAVRRREGLPDWIEREVDDFSNGPNTGNLILVRAAGEFNDPLPADLAARFPNIEIVDLRGVRRFWYLPLGQAARITDEKLKIIAPLLNLSREDMPLLRQEEERRQQTRLGAISGIAAAVLIAVTSLSFYALQSRWRAETALESGMFAAGRMVISVASELERTGGSADLRSRLVNEACDLIDKLSGEASREPQIREVVTCLLERAQEYERQKQPSEADAQIAAAIAASMDRYRKKARAEPALMLVEARRARIDLLDDRRDYAAIESELETLNSEAKDFAERYSSFSRFWQLRAESLAMLAALYRSREQIDKVTDALDTAVLVIDQGIAQGTRSSAASQRSWQAQLLDQVGEAYVKVGQPQTAVERFKSALQARSQAAENGGARVALDIDDAATLLSIARIEVDRDQAAAAEAHRQGLARLARAEGGKPNPGQLQRIAKIKAAFAALPVARTAETPSR
jgi:hypothetical protein